jgi:hypothetical protein
MNHFTLAGCYPWCDNHFHIPFRVGFVMSQRPYLRISFACANDPCHAAASVREIGGHLRCGLSMWRDANHAHGRGNGCRSLSCLERQTECLANSLLLQGNPTRRTGRRIQRYTAGIDDRLPAANPLPRQSVSTRGPHVIPNQWSRSDQALLQRCFVSVCGH